MLWRELSAEKQIQFGIQSEFFKSKAIYLKKTILRKIVLQSLQLAILQQIDFWNALFFSCPNKANSSISIERYLNA